MARGALRASIGKRASPLGTAFFEHARAFTKRSARCEHIVYQQAAHAAYIGLERKCAAHIHLALFMVKLRIASR